MDEQRWQARFFTIWIGQTFSLVGSTLVRFALIWWLTERTGSATVLALANLAAFLPIVALGPVMGALIDRWRRRWIMVVADGGVALLTAILALLFWLGRIQVWHVYLLLFLRAVGEGMHEPAMDASTTMLVPGETLDRVAGANQVRRSLTFLSGPVLGALLLEVLPIQGVLAIDVLTALPAILPLLFLDVPQPSGGRVATEGIGGWRAMMSETREGLRYVWNWRGLFVMFVTTSLIVFFLRPATSLIPLLVTEHFGRGAAEMGWLSGAFQIGAILSGISFTAGVSFQRRIWNIILAGMLYGMLNLTRGLVPPSAFWVLVAVSAIGGAAGPMFMGSLRAMLQSTVPPEMQGRVFATQNSIMMGMGPLGLITLGPLGDVIGVQPLFVFAGISMLLVGTSWILIPSVRNVEDGPPKLA